MIFHCVNRGNDRRELFGDDADYAAFERVLEAATVRFLAYCVIAAPIGVCCSGRAKVGIHSTRQAVRGQCVTEYRFEDQDRVTSQGEWFLPDEPPPEPSKAG